MESLQCCGYIVPDGQKDFAGHINDDEKRKKLMAELTKKLTEFQLVGDGKGTHILVTDEPTAPQQA